MSKIKLSYTDAFKIVEARDKKYADDVKTIIHLLKKRPCGSMLHQIGDISAERESSYLAKLYEDQIMSRATEFINAEFEAKFMEYMKQKHPTAVTEAD